MNVLFASSEVLPFSKTGGLADSTRSLSVSLVHAGLNVSIITPYYSAKINPEVFYIEKTEYAFDIQIGDKIEQCKIYKSEIPGTNITAFLVKNATYFDRPELYMEKGVGYADNDERFIFFSKVVIEFAKVYDIDVIHVNDWQTALVPVYLKTKYQNDEKLKNVKTVMTIHNLSFQGLYPASTMEKTNLDYDVFSSGNIEFWGMVNFMKGGLVYADYITTLSPKYAEEIQTTEYSFGLEGLLQYRSAELEGIINGVDSNIWNPDTDGIIYYPYDKDSLEEKVANKIELQRELGLPENKSVPLIGIVARMTEQKGMSLIVDSFDFFSKNDIQLVVLGTGNPEIENKMLEFAEANSSNVFVEVDFDEILAHKIDAAADIVLMPAKFEPSGLGVKFSLIYGTVPVVRNVGALYDYVVDYSEIEGNGFTFEEYDKDTMLITLEKAIDVYKNNKELWKKLQINCMSRDFSWNESAEKYAKIYNNIINKSI